MVLTTAIRDASPFGVSGSKVVLQVNPGEDLVVPIGQETLLDGSKSHATDGSRLAYVWKPIVTPEGAAVSLSDPFSATATWTPEVVGDYLFKLEVVDASGREGFAHKLITVSEVAPTIHHNPLQIRQLEDGRIELRWPDSFETQLETSAPLTPGSWSPLLQGVKLEGREHVLKLSPNELRQFFRLRASP